MFRSLLTTTRLWITALSLLVAGATAAGCGGDSGVGDPPDAGPERARRLVLLDDESVGILFGSSEVLRVRLEDVDGFPVPNAPVEFAFFVTPTESTGGAALSSRAATTDEAGVARVTVSAGAERANFRVRATAENATPVTYFIAVSELGFADIQVTPAHLGFRDADDFARIELRMYRHGFFRCDQLNPDFPPDTVFSIKSLPGFGGTARFPAVSALEPYTILAWAEVVERGTPVAVGCITLGAQQILPTPVVSVEVVVEDRALVMPDTALLESVLDLAPVADEASDEAWAVLACPLGPGQLLLDRVVIAAGEPLATDVASLRGVLDEGTGCRSAEDSEGGLSLDSLVAAAVASSGSFPVNDELEDVVAMRRAIAKSVRLRSELSAGASGVASHRLRTARFGTESASLSVDLTSSARPILAQTEVPVAVDGATMTIAAHSFTARLGPASRAAFVALGLAPASLVDDADALGSALVASVEADALSGCDAMGAIVCDAIAAPANCIADACTAATAALDAELDAWWQVFADDGLDLTLSGTATLYDFDNDLHVDSVGADNAGPPLGIWAATVTTTAGPIDTTGTLASQTSVPE